MPFLAGLRRSVAAIAFRFCVWRADAALARNAVWERRAMEWRQVGEAA